MSDADRELLYDKLTRHAAAGRLDVDDLERRVAIIAAATTREEAAAVMADLPPLAEAPARTERARWRTRRGRGHGQSDSPEPDWQPTDERFRDPRTNNIMRVWVDSLGGRHYVPES